MSIDLQAVSQQPRPRSATLTAGLALYTMFFGAGNVVFPLILGRDAGSKMPIALLGIAISGVLFPFLGLIAMLFSGGELKNFLNRLGKWPSFICNLLLNLSMGLFVSSRLFVLMHVSIKTFFPNLSLEIFCALISVLLFFLTHKPHRMITLLGTILTPLLLLVLGVLVVSGMISAPPLHPVSGHDLDFAMEGLKCGYQMMDLMAALVFSSLVFPHLMNQTSSGDTKGIFKNMLGASLIAASLLMITYVGLVWVAAHHCAELPSTIPSEELLKALAFKILGPQGGILASVIVFFACLTTAMPCASVFGKYLRSEIFQEKIHPHNALLLAITMAAILATVGFSGIMRIMTPVAQILYPSLIVVSVLNIANHLYPVQNVRAPVFFVLGFAAAMLWIS